MPPSDRDKDKSGSTLATETLLKEPRPAQWGQAPSGLLKENIFGSNAPKEIPCSSQAYFCENRSSYSFSCSRGTVTTIK